MSQKSSRSKYVAVGVVLIILIIAATFVVFTSRRRSEQLDEAYELLTQLKQYTQALAGSWDKIKSNMESLAIVEITDDVSTWGAGIDYSKNGRTLVSSIKNELSLIGSLQSNCDESLQGLEKLELPKWVLDYVALMKSMLEKDRDRASKSLELLDNMDQYYRFTELFLQGMIAENAMEQNLKDGSAKLAARNYAGASDDFRKALDNNSLVDKYAKDAAQILAMKYLDRVQANRAEAQGVIQKYLRVIDLAKAGRNAEADQMYREAEAEYRSLESKRLNAADLMPENRAWWNDHATSILNAVRQLTVEIQDLLHQAEVLVEKNKR